MTTISSTAARPASPATWGGFVRMLGSLLRAWANDLATNWVRREAIKTLEQLDDRALRDIGLPRCHIEAAVNGVRNPDLARMQ
jgi:uncharacterized protein YjiS (DUF1127 family)